MEINGRTSIFGLFGNPITGSLSPALHNAAFDALGLNCCYLPFPVQEKDLSSAVRALVPLQIKGVNVTAPYKEGVLPFLDYLSPEAQFLLAANTIVNQEGKLWGYNTDVDGLSYLLEEQLPGKGSGERVLLLGAGGVVPALLYALQKAGASAVTIANRRPERARRLVEQFAKFPGGRDLELDVSTLTARNLKHLVKKATLIINALRVDPYQEGFLEENTGGGRLGLAVDMRYNPPDNPFLQWARREGIPVTNGLQMLLGQGFKAFELFTGRDAPREVMIRAVVNRKRELEQ